jgi:sulfur carrier protein
VLVTVNGSERSVPDGATVEMLLAAVMSDDGAVSARGIAVALGGEVLPRSRWSRTALSPGAVVEVLTAVQGG